MLCVWAGRACVRVLGVYDDDDDDEFDGRCMQLRAPREWFGSPFALVSGARVCVRARDEPGRGGAAREVRASERRESVLSHLPACLNVALCTLTWSCCTRVSLASTRSALEPKAVSSELR